MLPPFDILLSDTTIPAIGQQTPPIWRQKLGWSWAFRGSLSRLSLSSPGASHRPPVSVAAVAILCGIGSRSLRGFRQGNQQTSLLHPSNDGICVQSCSARLAAGLGFGGGREDGLDGRSGIHARGGPGKGTGAAREQPCLTNLTPEPSSRSTPPCTLKTAAGGQASTARSRPFRYAVRPASCPQYSTSRPEQGPCDQWGAFVVGWRHCV